MAPAILIVEADQATATYLADQLDADGFRPVVTHTVQGARERGADIDPSLLGDLAEPRAQPALLAEIRAGTRPFDPRLSRSWSSPARRRARRPARLQHGADDVMARAVGYPELRARMRALLRRARRMRAGGDF